MKKSIVYLMLMFMAVAMFSCSKDEKNDPQPGNDEASIVGVWKYTDPDWEDGYILFTFRKDGTYTEGGYESDGTENWSDKGAYSISNDLITLVDSEVPDDNPEKYLFYRIITLTQNKLVIKYIDSDEIEEYTRVS